MGWSVSGSSVAWRTAVAVGCSVSGSSVDPGTAVAVGSCVGVGTGATVGDSVPGAEVGGASVGAEIAETAVGSGAGVSVDVSPPHATRTATKIRAARKENLKVIRRRRLVPFILLNISRF